MDANPQKMESKFNYKFSERKDSSHKSKTFGKKGTACQRGEIEENAKSLNIRFFDK